ncbi:(2Fe-2S) ferredoxin domain-containing protein [Iningainema tapete]|uniref:(2Fe-2S) ferredoxin domain-containing protein n=1 Tax=Iningainema tapete BLCC-T55 TaxID=2748662 RepID=A0A8J6XTK9_9CYAN|nr:(2Fe-2S) ferredoxin domain-containing protein [Iningainema tapete]MBD2773608.1 (2Fe-2S) ferredoxin domain-containing protein [Iningainema tapete BLCC-T55]
MNSAKYRVFVCTKQRDPNAPEGCCHNRGAEEIYQALQEEIKQQQLENQVEIRRSGCLDHCEAGVVALVSQPKPHEVSWLPTKVQKKLVSNKLTTPHLYLPSTAKLGKNIS